MSYYLHPKVFQLKVLWLCALLVTATAQADWYRDSQNIMGTRITVELWSDSKQQADQAIAAVMAEMRRIDQQLSPYIASSELSRVNQQAYQQPLVISDELYSLIERSLHYSHQSEGAFDITFASVGYLYDYRTGQRPSKDQLTKKLAAVNYRAVKLDPEQRTVRFLHPDTRIDLGGIAKGYAVDRGVEIVVSHGLVSAVVSAGGDSRILGNRGDRPWMMGIRHPRKGEGEFAVKIPLEDTALSTSGDYERFFMDDEQRRVHHILNPQSGESATGVQSVSILAEQAIDSDALSTTVFVLGVERGLALVNRLDHIDAIIIDGSGKLHYSEGLLRQVR